MTEVMSCNADCQYNKKGECTREFIEVDKDGDCAMQLLT